MSRTLKVTGNHVVYDRSAWVLRVIMPGSRALCFAFCHQWRSKKMSSIFFFIQCVIKQLLDSVFEISRIIKVSVRVISLSLRLRLITRTSTLIILDITKTSSNNCLLFYISWHWKPATSSYCYFVKLITFIRALERCNRPRGGVGDVYVQRRRILDVYSLFRAYKQTWFWYLLGVQPQNVLSRNCNVMILNWKIYERI